MIFEIITTSENEEIDYSVDQWWFMKKILKNNLGFA
jgi:hypothetical protein